MARKTRTVHVECADARGYRWLKQHVRGATYDPATQGFTVTSESEWAQCLSAAGGHELPDILSHIDRRPKTAARVSKPRVMYVVVSDGREVGAAYKTRALAETAASALPDAYVSEVPRGHQRSSPGQRDPRQEPARASRAVPSRNRLVAVPVRLSRRQLQAAVEALSMRLAGDLTHYDREMREAGRSARVADLHAAHSRLAAELDRKE